MRESMEAARVPPPPPKGGGLSPALASSSLCLFLAKERDALMSTCLQDPSSGALLRLEREQRETLHPFSNPSCLTAAVVARSLARCIAALSFSPS